MTLAAVVDQRSVIIPPMEIAQLVLDYVRALVWPVLLAAILWMGRKKIPELLSRLRSVEAPGFKANFAEALVQVEVGNVAAQAVIESTTATLAASGSGTSSGTATIVPTGGTFDDVPVADEPDPHVAPATLPVWWPTASSLELARVDDPDIAIERAWGWVERSLTELATTFGITQGDLSVLELAHVVLKYTSIRPGSYFEGGVSSLRKLRNQAVHGVARDCPGFG